MKVILKNLMEHKLQVLLIVLLLVVQAWCDLALPSYTSAIVDVGLEQYGIEDNVPETIRESTLAKLALFMEEEDEETVRSCYEEGKGENHFLHLSDISDAKREEIEKLLTGPEVMVYSMENMPAGAAPDEAATTEAGTAGANPVEAGTTSTETTEASAAEAEATGAASSAPGDAASQDPADQLALMNEMGISLPKLLTSGVDLTDRSGFTLDTILELMDKDVIDRDKFRTYMLGQEDVMFEQYGSMSDSVLSQVAAQFVRSEYEACNVNLESLQRSYLFRTGGKMMAISALMLTVGILCSLLSARVSASVGRSMRKRVFRKVMSFSNAQMDRFSTASLITRSTNDIQQVQFVTVMLLRMVAYAPILGAGGVIRVLSTKTGLGWIIVLAVVAVSILLVSLLLLAYPKFKIMQTLVDRLNLISRELLTGLSVIRAFGREKYEEERFDKANTDLMRTQLFTSRLMNVMMPAMMLLMNGVAIAIVWFGGHGIEAGNLQVGDMIAFITYSMQIIMSFLMIAGISIMLPRAGVAAERIQEVLDTEATVRDPEHPADDRLPKIRGELVFENVNFRYEGAKADALSGISFKAEPGKTTAIIGSTGCGKSTLVNLIPRFYDVTGGRITLDGIDIRDISLEKLRSAIGFVQQKAVLFSGDIMSNLRFADDDMPEEQAKKAAQIAQAEEFITASPDGWHHQIAQGGSNVSGGQKQRLSIARALAKRPAICVFDDSFSALDYKTDAILRKALREELGDTAVIIVAQRINTVLNADQILVLEEGRIVGAGTHAQLMESCTAYQEIARSQLSEEELKGGAAR